MTSIIKVDNLQNQCGANIISESSNVITIGASGDTVTLAAGASQSGFGRSGSVNWDTTPKTTSPVTAVSGNGYFINTTSIAITVNLPATPAAGDIVAIADYANTSATNNITVGRNGSKIDGETINAVINVNGQVYTLVYVDATEGWKTVNQTFNQIAVPTFIAATGGTILTCGDYKTHVFTGPGTFTVCSVGNPSGSNSVEYLVVAGGASGGSARGGGGGAGGFRQNFPSPALAGFPVTATGYPITVGGGGPPSTSVVGVSGNPSVFSTITSTGGGAGAGNAPGQTTALSGGSGGGGNDNNFPQSGLGNTPPVSPPQGNNGAPAQPGGGSGGGGGAAAAGSNSPSAGGAGGIGSPIATTFFGPTAPTYGTPGPAPGRYFAGGGGGGGAAPANPSGAGGAGGGGGGTPSGGIAGTINTGGGGGGAYDAGSNPSGGGGSGIVVIRYKYQ